MAKMLCPKCLFDNIAKIKELEYYKCLRCGHIFQADKARHVKRSR